MAALGIEMQPRDDMGMKATMRRWRASAAVLLVAISLTAAIPAIAEDGDDQSGPSASASDATNDCQNSGADLNGSYQQNPCNLTSTNQTLMDDDGHTFDHTVGSTVTTQINAYHGGEQVTNYLEGWWRNEALPALRAMTGQLNQSRLDQTRQIGSMMDAASTNEMALKGQKEELNANRRNAPSELACTSTTQLKTMDKAAALAKAVPKALKMDFSRRAAGAPGTPGEVGPAADQEARWRTYCDVFDDPDNNNGVSACPEQDDDDTDSGGGIPNGDVAVESLLLQDTIDVSDPFNYVALGSMVQNLVQPHIKQRLPEKVVNTDAGHEAILKQQHIDAIRNIAVHTISSIIARRTSVPLDQAETDAVDSGTSSDNSGSGSSSSGTGDDGTTQTFHASTPIGSSSDACASYDGSGYSACFAEHEMNRLASNQSERTNSPGPYTSAKATLCQHLSTLSSRRYSTGGEGAYQTWSLMEKKGLVVKNQQPQNAGDIVYWKWTDAHAKEWSKDHGYSTTQYYGHTGVYAGSSQAFSVTRFKGYPPITKHPMSRFSSSPDYVYLGYVPLPNDGSEVYQVDPSSGSQTSNPPPPKDPAERIFEIRERAGVDPSSISPMPSYNEVMLAMTKERFMDPEYFVRMQGNMSEIKQEQTSVNAFITAQYQDIYDLQEQINALLAARATLKLEMQKKGNAAQAAPIQ